MYGDLVLSPHEVDFGKGDAASKAVGIVLYMRYWIPVWNGASVESSVVSAGSPAAVLFWVIGGGGHRGPSARLAVPSRIMASNSALATAKRSSARRRGRQATGGPGVVRVWCVVLCRTSR